MAKATSDKSLVELDPVKMLLFFLAFLAICFFIILVIIVPNIKEYKAIQTSYTQNEMSSARLKNILNTKENELQNILKNNKKIFDALQTSFDEEGFIRYANKFFHDVTLSKSNNKIIQEEFTTYELNVTTSLKTPQNFYSFLEGLSHYKNIIKADFPIKMASDGTTIRSTFNIKVYSLTDN